MKAAQRVFVNTIAQYTRVLINMVLSLYTVRLVLQALGQSDYGIYTLIAGVVSMLAFITNSLVTATQRFISFYQGKNDVDVLKSIFNNSLLLHICVGLILVVILSLFAPFLFDGFLNIPNNRIHAANNVYYVVVIVLFITFLTSPFRALLVSHENIVYISIIDVVDAVWKLLLTIALVYTSYDKLIFYGLIILSIELFKFLALSIFCYKQYKECTWPKWKMIDYHYIKELLAFVGWVVYGTGCHVGQKQGVALVLNKLMGPVTNAAYGIGQQLSGYTIFLSTSLINAIKPQIVKSEGGGNRERALMLSNITSKMVFFLMSMISVPCMFEIDTLLTIWLGEVPQYTKMFCVMFILTLMADSLTIGLTHINQAIGKIGKYTVIMNTPKLLVFPLSWVVVKVGLPLIYVAVVYVGIELLMAFVRIPFIHYQANLNVYSFFKNVILMEIIPLLVCVITCMALTYAFEFQYRFLLTFPISIVLYSVSIYLWGLTNKEKEIVTGIFVNMAEKAKKIFR